MALLNSTGWIRNRNKGPDCSTSKGNKRLPVASGPKGVPRPPFSRFTHAWGNKPLCSQDSVAHVPLQRSICVCCSLTAREILLVGKVESKIRPRRGRKGKRRQFLSINKPCVPNFTLILSLAALPFCKYWVWEK